MEELFYSQFDRDFHEFLQRRKRELEEELTTLQEGSTLKDVRTELEEKLASSGPVINEAIQHELTQLEEHEIVTNILHNGTFTRQFKAIFAHLSAEDIRKEIDHLYQTQGQTCYPGDCSRTDTFHRDGPVQCDSEQDCGVGSNVEERISYDPFSGDSYTSILSDSEDEWVTALGDELDEFGGENLVSDVGETFKKQLTTCLCNPPQHTFTPTGTDTVLGSRELGYSYAAIGDTELRRGNMDKACSAYTEALSIGTEEDIPELVAVSHAGLGRVCESRRDRAAASTHYLTATRVLDTQLSTMQVNTLRHTVQDRLTQMERNVP